MTTSLLSFRRRKIKRKIVVRIKKRWWWLLWKKQQPRTLNCIGTKTSTIAACSTTSPTTKQWYGPWRRWSNVDNGHWYGFRSWKWNRSSRCQSYDGRWWRPRASSCWTRTIPATATAIRAIGIPTANATGSATITIWRLLELQLDTHAMPQKSRRQHFNVPILHGWSQVMPKWLIVQLSHSLLSLYEPSRETKSKT